MKVLDYQFRRLAFLQVLLGILAFCIAEGRPLLLAIVGLIAVVSWFYTETAGKRGISRQMLNLGAVGSVVLLTAEMQVTGASQPVALVGHFTLTLQLVLLFAEKSRREYLQLVALSTLQMLSASVLPGGVTLIYGLLLMTYCVLALLTALTFQLKSCGDLVHERQKRAATGCDAPAYPDPIGGPRQRTHFRLSAAVIGLVCALAAVTVFIVVPRSQQDALAIALTRPAGSTQAQAGFSNSIQLGGGAIGSGSPEPVLNLRVLRNGVSVGSEQQPWLMRGAVLDYYNPDTKLWTRSHQNSRDERVLSAGDRSIVLAERGGQPTFETIITLRRISEQNLFIPTPAEGFVATTLLLVPTQEHIQFNLEDQQLVSLAPSSRVQEYRVHLPVVPEGDIRESYRQLHPDELRSLRSQYDPENRYPHLDIDTAPAENLRPSPLPDEEPEEETDDRRGPRRWNWRNDAEPDPIYTTVWPVQIERVRHMTRSVLASHDMPLDLTDADAETRQDAARVLASHLRLNYTYTTSNPPSPASDPVIGFLFHNQSGHCELFASGLAAMCRSVGIPARVVTGFRAGEYNTIGDYYVVRQSHAHAWTEVDLGKGQGWYTLDATPAGEVELQHLGRNTGLLGTLHELYDHLEFSWIATVITFDKRAQEDLLGGIGQFLSAGPDSWARGARDWTRNHMGDMEIDQLGYVMMGVIMIALIIATSSLIRILILRHRRMVALQLTALPRGQRRLLARQLRFYIAMLEILERHGCIRPHWQSPYRFAHELAQQDQLRFEPVIALTELFYEVRFGRRSLDEERRNRVRVHLKRLEQTLGGGRT